MEMEGDFEGDTYDMPEQQDANRDENEGDNEEEIDREMGDGNDPNEQVVDQQMWDKDEDNLDEINQEEEKFEENSKMAGEKLADEMRTKDDAEGSDEQAKQGPEEHSADQIAPDESMDTNKDEQADNGNDQTEDKFEDSHGVDVRADENAAADEEELDIDLNEGLNIDDSQQDDEADQREDNVAEDVNDNPDPDTTMEENNGTDADVEEDEAEESEPIDMAGQGGNSANRADENQDEQEDEEKHEDEVERPIEPPSKSQHETREQLHGVAAPDGEDAVMEKNEDGEDDVKDGKAEEEAGGADQNVGESSQGSGGDGNKGAWQSGQTKEQEKERNGDVDDVPNPFRSPGDAEKFWHKKLDMIQDSPEAEESSPPQDTNGQDLQEQENMEQDGEFEYTRENEESSGQVLGVAEEHQAKQLKENNDDEVQPDNQKDSPDVEMEDSDQSRREQSKGSKSESTPKRSEEKVDSQQTTEKEEAKEDQPEHQTQDGDDTKSEDHAPSLSVENTLSSNRMHSEESDVEDIDDSKSDIEEVEVSTEFNALDLQQARVYWQTIQSETNNLSRRLCEKLRLVMEPLVATKLRGDYRTGKRVNMKRIIGYIASGYRKDKIWLRRTKPAKRDYRILIAVDDSESMQKSQAGDMALRALSTLANGMSQLEIGQLGIASFGEEMKLIHPFNLPFTSESGVNVVSNFTFNQKRTRTALCVESSITALEGVDSVSSSMQLVFMISDGRIERDSRSKLRRLIRQMSEKNMLMVMIIVEGEGGSDSPTKSNESILNMKEVSFVNGKPKIKHFIEDYPFPYYLVVNDLAALPEILGDALRQWFEMMAQIQNGM
jgi:midasin